MKKNDINLIPRRKVLHTGTLLIILLIVLVLAGVLFTGTYFPSQSLEGKKQALSRLKKDLEEYADIEMKYQKAIIELNQIDSQIKNLEEFLGTEQEYLDTMEEIRGCLLDGMNIESQINMADYIEIRGVAASDRDIANFERNLINLEKYEVKLESVIGTEDGLRIFKYKLEFGDYGTTMKEAEKDA